MITATPTTPIHPINKTPIIMYFCRRMNCRRRRTPCWYCQRTSLTSLSSRILHKKTHEVVKIRLVIVDVEGLLVYVASGPFWIAELFIEEETPKIIEIRLIVANVEGLLVNDVSELLWVDKLRIPIEKTPKGSSRFVSPLLIITYSSVSNFTVYSVAS